MVFEKHDRHPGTTKESDAIARAEVEQVIADGGDLDKMKEKILAICTKYNHTDAPEHEQIWEQVRKDSRSALGLPYFPLVSQSGE